MALGVRPEQLGGWRYRSHKQGGQGDGAALGTELKPCSWEVALQRHPGLGPQGVRRAQAGVLTSADTVSNWRAKNWLVAIDSQFMRSGVLKDSRIKPLNLAY